MPLNTSSYFAGVATVVGTIALGFGGGVLMTDAFVGKSDNQRTLIERRNAPLPEAAPPITAAVAEPASQTAVATVAPTTPQPAPPLETTTPTVSQPAVAVQAAPLPAAPSSPAPRLATQQSQPLQQTQVWQGAVTAPQPDQAMARANDAEIRKMQAAERRKAERRKWAERRKQEKQKLEELDAVAEKVRQVEQQREPVGRSFVAESPRIVLPGIDD